MARISMTRVGALYRATLKGRLSARDLKRLERACGSALVQKRLPLEVNLQNVTSLDEAARAYLEKLRARGARVYGWRLDFATEL
ncbi:MAG TPA: hypothetical protein VH583_14410 [Vicinamibacterales bacterium]